MNDFVFISQKYRDTVAEETLEEMKRIRENFPVDGTTPDIQSLY